MSGPKRKAISVGLSLLVVMTLLTGTLAYEQVPEGHQGVEKDFGAVNGDVRSPGANLILPVMQGIQPVETRPRTYTMSKTEGEGQRSEADAIRVKTVNGSSVDVDLTVRYRIKSGEADAFVREWNDEQQMESRLIRPTIRSVLRDEASSLETTGQDAIYTQEGRAALQQTAEQALRQEFEDQPVVLEAVQIRNIDLPDEIDRTLDEKESAKQQVQVEQEKVKQEEARARQKIVRAEADAEAIEIRGEALNDNEVVLRDRYIEALKQGDTIYVPTEGGGLTLTREADGNNNNSTDTSDG